METLELLKANSP